MGEELARRCGQEQAADNLEEALTVMAGHLLDRAPAERETLTAVSPEQVDLGKALDKVGKRIPGFVARIVPGEVAAEEWLTLGRVLEALGSECRRVGERGQVIVEVDDAGDEQADE